MIIDFRQRYGHLRVEGLPKQTLKSKETRGGYLPKQTSSSIPEEYRKVFEHTPEGFVENYCKG